MVTPVGATSGVAKTKINKQKHYVLFHFLLIICHLVGGLLYIVTMSLKYYCERFIIHFDHNKKIRTQTLSVLLVFGLKILG